MRADNEAMRRARLARAAIVAIVVGVSVLYGAAAWLRQPRGGVPDYDPAAVVACGDFRRLIQDIGNDLLTPEAFRARIRSFAELARLADPTLAPGVAADAQTLLRVATTGTAPETLRALDLVKHACSLAGAKMR